MSLEDEKKSGALIEVNSSSSLKDDNEVHLEKNFNLLNTCAMQYSLICSPIAVGTFLNVVIGIGGSPGFLYGYLLAVSLDLVVCYCLAELASAYPSSSAQVHWTYCLAPRHLKRSLSFAVGVLSCAGWIFACFSVSYTTSMFILTLAKIYNPDYSPEPWHYYVIYAAIIITCYLFNVLCFSTFSYVNYFLVFVINAGTLFIVITLLVRSNHKRSAHYVFAEFINETGWSSNGVTFFLGLLPSIATVTFFDNAPHMTNEIPNPQKNIPLVMVISNTVSAVVAFLAAVVYMFCVVSEEHMSDPIGGQPFIQLMLDAFRSEALTTLGSVILIITFYGSLFGYVCSSSRLFLAFSKRKGLPFGDSYLDIIHPTLKTPVNALTLVTVISLLIGLIIFGPSTALAAFLGSSSVCIYLSYIFPIACNLYFSKFAISSRERFPNDTSLAEKVSTNPKTDLPYFHLGRSGVFLNVVSVAWTCFIVVWLNFPTSYPVNKNTMNYSCVILGSTFFIALTLWFGYARKNYNHDINVNIL
ncbi:Piso0_005106 [Millerozyma farinosa CBS 7064]|uniref:Piso0_005106 protein n=1 Tax=Pichia sorbitophila (strain ATCC MYA-4447 / BCRC 22081 / CBS 7064 / NBRC 10061 / NRRL Y-12695) TaxID=559304 RepID=G8Y489_PICSO|nr:Piso0_005106 [Millerozyma farinosa CBS 7064]